MEKRKMASEKIIAWVGWDQWDGWAKLEGLMSW